MAWPLAHRVHRLGVRSARTPASGAVATPPEPAKRPQISRAPRGWSHGNLQGRHGALAAEAGLRAHDLDRGGRPLLLLHAVPDDIRVSIDGPGNHDLSQHAIFCFWHESWLSYCVVFNRYPSPHTMISHPAAYMRPSHIQFRLMGLTPLMLGYSGEEGRRAADAVAALVGRGLSTSISTDGPYGPPRVLKKGVLHIARKSGVPIVPLTIRASRGLGCPAGTRNSCRCRSAASR